MRITTTLDIDFGEHLGHHLATAGRGASEAVHQVDEVLEAAVTTLDGFVTGLRHKVAARVMPRGEETCACGRPHIDDDAVDPSTGEACACGGHGHGIEDRLM